MGINIAPIEASKTGRFRTAVAVSFLTFLTACGGDDDSSSGAVTQEPSVEGQEVIAELAAQVPANAAVIRGERNCELFELDIKDGNFIINVWNNVGQGHECPDAWLATVDTNTYKVDGPRWRPIDHTFGVDNDRNLIADSGALTSGNPQVREIPENSGTTMLLAATVTVAPVAAVSQQAGFFIGSMDDVPQMLRDTLLNQSANQTVSYSVVEVDRVFNTFWVYLAGKPVYVLSDGNCEYAMKYYTSSINPLINSEAVVANLANLLQNLPAGYSFEVRQFEDNVYVLDLDNKQSVVNDEFGNSYDRLWCGDALVPYTVL